jgi:hypothetical protein
LAQTQNPHPKYANHAQLIQGASQVTEPSLSQGGRLFIITLAAFSVKENPHPGNEKLAVACGVKSRQGVNYIAQEVIRKKLVEVVAYGRGGHGMAVEYRLCTEDPRFPPPPRKPTKQPATSDLHVVAKEPATSDLRDDLETTCKLTPKNPQVSPSQPASSDLHPNTRTNTKTNTNQTNPIAPANTAAPGIGADELPAWVPRPQWDEFQKARRKRSTPYARRLLISKLEKLRADGNDPTAVLEQSITNCWSGLFPINKPGARERQPSGAVPPEPGKQYPTGRVVRTE